MSAPSFSFEYFPPKTEASEKAFWEAVPELAALGPKFMTITYGAGGSTRDKTLEIAAKLHTTNPDIPIAAHLTFINTVKEDLYKITDALWESGIRHIVALRGDMPGDLHWPLDPDGDYFQVTSEFVAALKARHGFEVSVGAYPEKHPDAPDMAADIIALKKKCDAGADRAITQFFFDNDAYYSFTEQCRAAGITTPIYPGLLPVHDYAALVRFAGKCGACLPEWLQGKFEDVSLEDARKIAEDLLTGQVLDLIDQGVEHFHFYTLNKADITASVCKLLRG